MWSLISAVGIFCLGSGATIMHGIQNLWNSEVCSIALHIGHFKFILHFMMKMINLFNQSPENIHYAALVIGGSFLIEGMSVCIVYVWMFGILSLFIIATSYLMIKCALGASLLVAINAVKKGAASEGMTIWDYVWRGHDPTSVAVMIEVFVF